MVFTSSPSGGYVGLEFAQLFRRLGSTVTIIQRGSQLLPREDADMALRMHDILAEDDISIYLSTLARSVSYDNVSSTITLIAAGSSETSETATITGISHLLLATGRTPNTDTLDIARTGLAVDPRGYISVSPTLATNVAGIYAIGDCKGPPAFTHISYDDFRILRANLLPSSSAPAGVSASTTDRLVPYVVYTDPQLGHVGIHEREAKAAGMDILVAKMEMSSVARALETAETRGCMKAVVERTSGHILGFTCLGIEGGEIMAVVQTAMMGGLTWKDLQRAVWAHPSLAEGLNNLWGGWE
jgi:pyruvate/2-oxoglutarate dehydrogenase complex dihydrolipoamide dehydrogenase (E3) component